MGTQGTLSGSFHFLFCSFSVPKDKNNLPRRNARFPGMQPELKRSRCFPPIPPPTRTPLLPPNFPSTPSPIPRLAQLLSWIVFSYCNYIRLQSYIICQLTSSPAHQLTSSPAHQLTSSPAHQLTSSPAHQLTSSPAHQLTSTLAHQYTSSPVFTSPSAH